jgi:hypothetical protein
MRPLGSVIPSALLRTNPVGAVPSPACWILCADLRQREVGARCFNASSQLGNLNLRRGHGALMILSTARGAN